MKSKSITPMGALHPILFFAGVYIVALLFSIFICSSLFYSFNGRSANNENEVSTPVKTQSIQATTAVIAVR
jgi:cytochrome c biogenesis factor